MLFAIQLFHQTAAQHHYAVIVQTNVPSTRLILYEAYTF